MEAAKLIQYGVTAKHSIRPGEVIMMRKKNHTYSNAELDNRSNNEAE